MSIEKVPSKCPVCGANAQFTVEVKPEVQYVPYTMETPNRIKIKPTSSIMKYVITSDMLRAFIKDKCKNMPSKYDEKTHEPIEWINPKVEVVPKYTEKKKRKGEQHKSYACFIIAFSEDVRKTGPDFGWYGKIGDNSNGIEFVKSVKSSIIDRYSYDRKSINLWLSSYKDMERLEEGLGITEDFLRILQEFSTPRITEPRKGESWITFAAAPEKVIADALADPKTNTVPGRIQITDITPIDKKNFKFTVLVHPIEDTYEESAIVKQILEGTKKIK